MTAERERMKVTNFDRDLDQSKARTGEVNEGEGVNRNSGSLAGEFEGGMAGGGL